MANAEIPVQSPVLLVVDDDPGVLAFIRTVLEGAGYTIIVAHSGMDALMKSRECDTKVDLLLTDVIMADLNGPNLADYLLRQDASLRVLFMSGWEPHVIAHAGALSRGFTTLAKPFTAGELLSTVECVLKRTGPVGTQARR